MGVNVKAVLGSIAVCGVLVLAGCSSSSVSSEVATPDAQVKSPFASEASRTTFEAIVSYDVVAEVQPNTDMVITETIVYDPGTEEVRRGIIRDIPVRDSLDSGDLRLYDVQLLSVTRDSDQVPYTESTSDDAISLKIGDPNVPIQGLHTFVISYRVGGALNIIDTNSINATTPKGITAGDISLYWDFIGGQWPFPVIKGKGHYHWTNPSAGGTVLLWAAGIHDAMQGHGGRRTRFSHRAQRRSPEWWRTHGSDRLGPGWVHPNASAEHRSRPLKSANADGHSGEEVGASR